MKINNSFKLLALPVFWFLSIALPSSGGAEPQILARGCLNYEKVSDFVHLTKIDLKCQDLQFVVDLDPHNRKTVTEFVNSNRLLVAINGDYPRSSLNINDGKVLAGSSDRLDRSFLACDSRYECIIDGKNTRTDVNPDWVFAVGGWQSIIDGEFKCDGEKEVRCKESYANRPNPRTAIGLNREKKELYFIVVEGRQPSFPGVTLQELSELFRKLAIPEGLNLDGGGSSTMIIDGRRVNRLPIGQTFERPVIGHFGIKLKNDSEK